MKRISVVKNDILCKYLNECRNSLAKDRFKNTPSFTFKNCLFDKVTISSNNNLGYSFKAYCSKLTEDYNHYKENNILVTLSVKFWNSKGLIEYLRENFNNLNLYGVNAIFSPDNKNEQLKSVLDILRTSNLEYRYIKVGCSWRCCIMNNDDLDVLEKIIDTKGLEGYELQYHDYIKISQA